MIKRMYLGTRSSEKFNAAFIMRATLSNRVKGSHDRRLMDKRCWNDCLKLACDLCCLGKLIMELSHPGRSNKHQRRGPYLAQLAFHVAAEHIVSVLTKHIVQGVPDVHHAFIDIPRNVP